MGSSLDNIDTVSYRSTLCMNWKSKNTVEQA